MLVSTYIDSFTQKATSHNRFHSDTRLQEKAAFNYNRTFTISKDHNTKVLWVGDILKKR